MMKAAALLCAALMLLLPGTLTEEREVAPIDVLVDNSLLGLTPVTFSTHVVYRGILLGGLRRLMASNGDFKFTYTEDPNYGPSLESVNGVAGNVTDRTYWELLVKTPDGEIKRPDVGIGCYIPSPNEQIILRFSKWFTYTEDQNYGPSLESVNGVAGNVTDRTYWELLVKTPDGEIKRPDVGIGCYIPSPNEQIILRFSKW